MELTLKLKQTNVGELMYLPNDQYVGRSLELYSEFSAGEQEFFKFAARGGAAIDVGANIGVHSRCMASCYSSVYSFEPQRILYRILRANLADYSSSVQYHSTAGAEDGIIYFPELDYSAISNFGGVGKYTELPKTVNMYKVQQRKLDGIEALRAEAKLDLIKIDVEGMEREVLDGALALINKHRPLLYVENDKPDRSAALVQFIYNLGYKAYWHVTYLFNPANVAGNTNNVFENIASFNLICIPEGHWMSVTGCKQCTPDNPYVPEGCIA